MTVLSYIYNDRFLPTEKEIANHCSKNNGETEPSVVRHKNQHQHER